MDWAAATGQAVEHLRRMIRMDTTNPPGNELELGRYLATTLGAAGIETELFEPVHDRAAVVARIPGNGARKPVLLLAHMDVVGVERERWSVDPFGGEIRDGYLYGRGAIDDKGMLAVNLVTMLLLQQHVVSAGRALARDVVFVATSDEEAGGAWGIEWLLDHHPELLHAEFALNEGGRIRIVNGEILYAAVQNAEKVSHIVTVTARGPVGHASIPLEGNAVARLARALAAITEHREPVTLLPTTRGFFGGLAAVWGDATEAKAMADVASGEPDREARGASVLAATPTYDAVLRAGISPTMISGGMRFNVFPAEARATLNVRTLPGQSSDEVIARLDRVVDDPQVEIVLAEPGQPAPVSDFESEMFAAITGAMHALAPDAVTVPYLSTGATDSARLRAHGVQAYGLLPFPLEPDDERRMHGHDERVSLASLEFGTRLVFSAVHEVAS